MKQSKRIETYAQSIFVLSPLFRSGILSFRRRAISHSNTRMRYHIEIINNSIMEIQKTSKTKNRKKNWAVHNRATRRDKPEQNCFSKRYHTRKLNADVKMSTHNFQHNIFHGVCAVVVWVFWMQPHLCELLHYIIHKKYLSLVRYSIPLFCQIFIHLSCLRNQPKFACITWHNSFAENLQWFIVDLIFEIFTKCSIQNFINLPLAKWTHAYGWILFDIES